MAGRTDQRHVAAVQRLRARADGEDAEIRARQDTVDSIRVIEHQIEELRVGYQAKLDALGAERTETVGRSTSWRSGQARGATREEIKSITAQALEWF